MVASSKGQQNVNALEMVFSGSVDVTKNANETNGYSVFTHDLGYEPVYFAYASWNFQGTKRSSYQYALPFIQAEPEGVDAGKQQFRMNCIANSANIACYLVTDHLTTSSGYYSSAIEATFYLYIFKEQILRSQ